ncbi:MAG: NUDIX domain-containing protein [bacterium]|nr:NUDIX domain-containing protein [bacterium]
MTNDTEKQIVTLKGIFCRDNKFLLLKQTNGGFWELPGGRLELGEKIENCFTREITEELGWPDIKLDEFIHVWTLDRPDKMIRYVLIGATAMPTDKPIILSDEHTEHGWFSLPEIEQLKMRSAGLIDAIKKSIKK